MNKRIITIMTCGLLAFSMYSQISIKDVYKEFSKESNASDVNLNKLAMLFMRPFVDNKTDCEITSIRILSLEECSRDVKERFNKTALRFDDNQYELFVSSNEKDEKVRIFLKFNKEIINEMVILTIGEDPVLVHLKGKIRPSDIENMSNGWK